MAGEKCSERQRNMPDISTESQYINKSGETFKTYCKKIADLKLNFEKIDQNEWPTRLIQYFGKALSNYNPSGIQNQNNSQNNPHHGGVQEGVRSKPDFSRYKNIAYLDKHAEQQLRKSEPPFSIQNDYGQSETNDQVINQINQLINQLFTDYSEDKQPNQLESNDRRNFLVNHLKNMLQIMPDQKMVLKIEAELNQLLTHFEKHMNGQSKYPNSDGLNFIKQLDALASVEQEQTLTEKRQQISGQRPSPHHRPAVKQLFGRSVQANDKALLSLMPKEQNKLFKTIHVKTESEQPKPLQTEKPPVLSFHTGPMNKWQQLMIHEINQPKTANNQSIVEQISQYLSANRLLIIKNGGHEFSIKLYPDHLGELKILIHTEKGSLTAKILASTSEAKQMLQSQLHHLKQSLIAADIPMQKVEIDLSTMDSRHESSFSDGQKDQSGKGQERHSKRHDNQDEKGISNDEKLSFFEQLAKEV